MDIKMKQDINLMPPVERKTNKVLQGMLVALLIGALLVAAVYYGVVQPINQKNGLQAQLDQYNQQLEGYANVQQEYTNLKTQQDQIQQLLVAMDRFQENIQWSTLWKEIDGCLPNNLTFSGLSYSDHLVSISGVTGLDDVTLAAMMNKLRQLENVVAVSIGSYSESEATQSFDLSITLGTPFDLDIPVDEETESETGEEAS